MNNLVEDRRTRKTNQTKKLLKQSLCHLLTIKPIENITIQEITDAADLNRRTFYTHYQDIYDLFEHVKRDTIDDFINLFKQCLTLPTTQIFQDYLERLLEYIQENTVICKIVFQQEDPDFMDYLAHTFFNCFVSHYPSSTQTYEATYIKYKFIFFSHGMAHLISTWLSEDMPLTASELSNLLYQFIFSNDSHPITHFTSTSG